MDGMKPHDVSFWAYVFCHTVNTLSHGQRCLVYTFPAFADTGACALLGDRELWIANYDTPQPHIPPPWSTFAFWQYTGKTLDRDMFNGTDKDLEKFCTR
jgi:lysozyme